MESGDGKRQSSTAIRRTINHFVELNKGCTSVGDSVSEADSRTSPGGASAIKELMMAFSEDIAPVKSRS